MIYFLYVSDMIPSLFLPVYLIPQYISALFCHLIHSSQMYHDHAYDMVFF